MTEVHRQISSDAVELTVLGHCNAGRINGTDLCCCAVSMLVYTIMDTLGRLNLKNLKQHYGGGWCKIRYDRVSPDSGIASVALDTVMNGFELLEKSYPANLKIYENERKWKDERYYQ